MVELVDSPARLYPVGRLDADSTGLLLLTNDGELANHLTHPRYEVSKAYRVQLRRPPAGDDLRRLASGVSLEDGPTAPAGVRRLGEREIDSRRLGEMVMEELRKLDKVAYIRFASVYKSFSDVEDFRDAIREVRDTK